MEPLPQFHRKLHTCSGNAIHVSFIKKVYQYEYNDWGIALIRLSITFHIYTQLIRSPFYIPICMGNKHTDDFRCCICRDHWNFHNTLFFFNFLYLSKDENINTKMLCLFSSDSCEWKTVLNL